MTEKAVMTPFEVEPVDSVHLVRVVTRYRWLIAIVVLLSLAAGIAAAFLMQPVFRAEVVLMPAESQELPSGLGSLADQFGGLAGLAGIRLPTGGRTEEALATLRSQSLIREFIVDKDLLPMLFADKWNSEQNAWQDPDPSQHPTLNDAVARFDEDIRVVTEDPTTGKVTLAIEWTHGIQAAAWANELAMRVNKNLRDRDRSQALKGLDYLNQELAKTGVIEVQQAIYRLIEQSVNVIMLTNVREDYAFKLIDPAVAPDEDDFIRPRRALLVAIGLAFGVIAGVGLALLADALRPQALRA